MSRPGMGSFSFANSLLLEHFNIVTGSPLVSWESKKLKVPMENASHFEECLSCCLGIRMTVTWRHLAQPHMNLQKLCLCCFNDSFLAAWPITPWRRQSSLYKLFIKMNPLYPIKPLELVFNSSFSQRTNDSEQTRTLWHSLGALQPLLRDGACPGQRPAASLAGRVPKAGPVGMLHAHRGWCRPGLGRFFCRFFVWKLMIKQHISSHWGYRVPPCWWTCCGRIRIDQWTVCLFSHSH